MAGLLVLAALLAGPLRHPIHSSAATITVTERGAVSVELRVFAEDFPPRIAKLGDIQAYLDRRFQVIDRSGRRLPLHVAVTRIDGAVLIIGLGGDAPNGLKGVRIWHGVLIERFGDQVNMVQVRRAGRSASLLFTASDGPKQLP